MAEFKPYIQEQGFIFPPHLSDLIPDNHLVRVVSEIVDQLDLTEITDKYVYHGAEAYHPKLLTKILFYGYSTGTMSSRKIGDKLTTDITFMWLAAMQKPDFRTISDFRKNHRAAVEKLFTQIVVLANHMGLTNMGHVSIDGSKINANASKHKAMSRGRLKQEISKIQNEIKELLDEAEQIDLEEDKEDKDDANTLPPELSNKKERLAKLEQALKDLNEQKPEEKAKNQKEADKQQINFTDKESRIMSTRHHGVQQSYNGQIAVDEQCGIIVGATLTNDAFDTDQLKPLLNHVKKINNRLPDKITADTGYFTADNIKFCDENVIDAYIAPTREGKSITESFDKTSFAYDSENDVYICPESKELKLKGKRKRKSGKKERIEQIYKGTDCIDCPSQSKCVKSQKGIRQVQRSEDDPILESMTAKVRSEEGQEIYRKRKGIVEPVWGQIKAIQKFRQFSFRGLQANTAELLLVAIGHNLRKIFFNKSKKMNAEVACG